MAIPVSLEDAKRQLRYEDGEELPPGREADIEGFIADAAAWVERYTGHILTTREVTEDFGSFDRLALRAWPVKPDASVAVSYVTDGEPIALPSPRLSVGSRRAAALPAFGTTWPVLPRGGRVTVKVQAGYGPTDPVPGNFRRAMLVLIAAYDADREGGEMFAKAEASARALCRSFRVMQL